MAKTKLIEDVDHDYKLFPEDILIYAQEIGIDVENEQHLMWIAKEGLAAKVPEPWSIFADNTDRVFYYNEKTKESSWLHPRDKDYCALVVKERAKSKSSNSTSSDCGFESKLSSLADAPPLSSSGLTTPTSSKHGKTNTGNKRLDIGHFENRRGTQLAPVRLNSLKMPVPSASPKSGTGMSFMPKGSSFSRNIRRVKEPEYSDSELAKRSKIIPSQDEYNESGNSDDNSKYSYEETDDEEKDMNGIDPYDLLDTSQLSPVHSTDESPDAFDINSLVQLGTKVPSLLDTPRKKEDLSMKESSPSLNLRKIGQPSLLKPLQQATKKKNQQKSSKNLKKQVIDNIDPDPGVADKDLEEKITALNEEQKLMLESIHREWAAMQENVEREEKEKYEQMISESSRKLEEEELKLRKDTAEKISKLKGEMQKKVEDEENAAQRNLEVVKKSNEEKVNEEKQKMKDALEVLSKSLKDEFEKLEKKNAKELNDKKKELEEKMEEGIEKMKISHTNDLKAIQEAHAAEFAILEKAHKEKITEMQKTYEKEEMDVTNKVEGHELVEKDNLLHKIKELEKVVQEAEKKHQNLLTEIENKKSEISNEKDILLKIKEETVTAQTYYEEIQDEVEKTENDLDLLRSEKSALISELSILKDNINNEKSNLLNLTQKQMSPKHQNSHDLKNYAERGVNTVTMHLSTFCKSSQTLIYCMDASSQVRNIIPVIDTQCQTIDIEPSTANKHCQVNLVPCSEINKAGTKNIDSNNGNGNLDLVLNKSIENALNSISIKMESRIQVIEDQLKLLQDSIIQSSNNDPKFSAHSLKNPLLTEVKSLANVNNGKGLSNIVMDSALSVDTANKSIPSPSHNKCMCVNGDPSSCEVMQDVKSSIYRLNDILSHGFSPTLNNSVLFEYQHPINHYSSPVENFYPQFRELQEKHRIIDLKHKCENEAIKQAKNVLGSNLAAHSNINDFSRGFNKSSHHSNLHTLNLTEDPLLRARSLVLREQARSWKQQQQNNSPAHQIILPSETRMTSYTHFPVTPVMSSLNGVSSLQHSFHSFEQDPETDYNTWMIRLNALQQKIRSHKLF